MSSVPASQQFLEGLTSKAARVWESETDSHLISGEFEMAARNFVPQTPPFLHSWNLVSS